jgi:hypothetical protein
MSSNPFEWVKSICETKENLLDTTEKTSYNPYIVNKSLSHQIDCLLFSNEMNFRHFLDKDIQYTFLLNSIRKRPRPHFWVKSEKLNDIKYIKKYYNCSNDKAYQALKLLSKDQIDYIKNKLENFGLEPYD